MNKKGFTLVELIGVIVLLAAIALIAVPQITKTIDRSKEKTYRDQIDALLQASRRYVSEIGPKNTNPFTITLQELMSNQLIEKGTKIKKKNNEDVSSKIELEVTYNESSKSYIYVCYIRENESSRTEC